MLLPDAEPGFYEIPMGFRPGVHILAHVAARGVCVSWGHFSTEAEREALHELMLDACAAGENRGPFPLEIDVTAHAADDSASRPADLPRRAASSRSGPSPRPTAPPAP